MASLLLPVCLLGASFLSSSHLFHLTLFPDDVPPLIEEPVLLYTRSNLSVYYTSNDLLHPRSFGAPGQFYEAIIFDIWPSKEGEPRSISSLTWIRQIAWALALRNAQGERLPDSPPTQEDQSIMTDFSRTFFGAPKLERGKTASFIVPPDSTYSKRSGIQAFIGMAIKDVGKKRLYPNLVDSPQLFGPSLALAFGEIANKGLTGVGVPFMHVSGSLGKSAPQSVSWQRILEEVDRKAISSGVKTVVLGGYGLIPRNRELTDKAFREAWGERQRTIANQSNLLEHEPIRLTALISLSALAGAIWKRKAFNFKRLIAIFFLGGALAASIISLFDWFMPLLSGTLSREIALSSKVAFALVIGVLIDYVAGLEPKKDLLSE